MAEQMVPIESSWTMVDGHEPGYQPAGPLDGDRDVDVVVIGAGVAGLSVAERLRAAGADVVVLERHGVGTGVTGGSTAKVTALHGTLLATLRDQHGPEAASLYATVNAVAVEDVAETVERHGIDCDLRRAASVNYATTPEGRTQLDADAAAASEAGLDVHLEDRTELPFAVTGAEVLPGQVHLHPRRYCEGLAATLGTGAVRTGAPVMAVDEDDDGCHARTPSGTVHARHAVVATQGPIVDPRLLANRCRPSRSYVVAVEVDGPIPQDLYLSVDQPTRSLRPATIGGVDVLLVGGEGHPVGDETDAVACLEALESWAREHFAVRAVGRRWAAHDHVPTDHLPFVGRLTPGSNRWVATGFQKWGFSTSGVAGAVIAAGIAGEDHPATRLLDPARLRSTLTRQLAQDGLRVTSRLVGDRVAVRVGRRSADLAALGPGDGIVAHTDRGPTAVCRDGSGTLHEVSAVCTHQGCLVRFNRAQVSWDCPCHGSRYAPDGTVLAGPATKDLAPVEATDRPD
ncbi:MAG TPA: FAD-dependent oxidoreductase [Acidimicrobiales bacterium]|nr:FAD-dependent oxidoreductase [Acidimicrobiales bacterium]